MSARNLTAALDAARWLEPPRRPTPCRAGHDPQYSRLVGQVRPYWSCAVCRKQWERRRAQRPPPDPPTDEELTALQSLNEIARPVERLAAASRLWRAIRRAAS